MLSNLINNSVEAISEKGEIVLALRSQNADGFDIIIKDTGAGIPSSILDRLGREKVESTKRNVEGGHGVGLFHSRRTIEALGGSMQIQSKVGMGTLITLSFRNRI